MAEGQAVKGDGPVLRVAILHPVDHALGTGVPDTLLAGAQGIRRKAEHNPASGAPHVSLLLIGMPLQSLQELEDGLGVLSLQGLEVIACQRQTSPQGKELSLIHI